VPETGKGVRFHDGFYLRLAVGIGGVSGRYRGDFSGADKFDVSGIAALDEVAFGGTPSPGVVIGGGIYGSTTPSPTMSFRGVDQKMGAVGVGVVGPFVDVYPNPQVGFHVQGAIGLAVLSAAKGDAQLVCNSVTSVGPICVTEINPPDDYFGTGLGVVVGAGYEGWIGDQWSIGGMARLTYASGTLRPMNETIPDVKASVLVPGALFTVTYH